mgnify:CR=1 FL=1
MATATLISYPSALCLAGNISPVRVSAAGLFAFRVKKGSAVLLEEDYVPDANGQAEIDIRDIVLADLSLSLPTSDVYKQSSAAGSYTITTDTDSKTFKAVLGGIDNPAMDAATFLRANFLTWQPQIKSVTYNQPEWLSFYVSSTQTILKARFYLKDGTASDIVVAQGASFDPGCVYSVSMQFVRIWSLGTGDRYGMFDVWVEDGAGTKFTYTQRYVLDASGDIRTVLVARNSIGGIDTFAFHGDMECAAEAEHSNVMRGDSMLSGLVDLSRIYTMHTGILSRHEQNWAWDLQRSPQAWVLMDGALRPVVMLAPTVTASMLEDSSGTVDFRLSDDSGYLNIQRLDTVPGDIEIPGPDGEVFFLAPRLVEFPDALAGNSLLFPVQSPFEQKWYKMTLGEIRSQLLGSVAQSGQFLSRLADDIAKGNITFEKMIQVLGLSIFRSGAEFGSFIKSLHAGTGAGIDAAGNAEFESVRVRSYFECLELIVNRLSAIEGDLLLTEADTIDSVSDLGDNCFGLTLRRKWEGYFTAQVAGNILKGIFNTLSAGSGQYYTSWMRVNSVNAASNYIEVTMYPDKDTPAGRNHPPVAMMKIARWGNQTDTTRQSCIYLSSTEGRIVRLTGVTKPLIDPSNYGASFGTIPDFLKSMDLPIIEHQDYIYARGLIVQDIVRVDYAGKPVSEIVDRGPWGMQATYYCEDVNPDTGQYEISDVWHMGCRWRCAKTCKGSPPAWNNTDWFMIEGNPGFSVDFRDTDYIFDPDRFNVTLSIVATLYNQDVTADILDADVQWTRYSEDADGNERVTSDQAWALKRAGAGKSLALTSEDCDFDGYIPGVLRFTATVTLRDGMNSDAATASAAFEL